MGRTKTIYQIDYIDENEQATYIKTFSKSELNKAIKEVNLLNYANACINADTYFVLDEYMGNEYNDDSWEISKYNITKAESINDRKERVKVELKLKQELNS